MPSEHIIFIPGVLLIGVMLGYMIGTRVTRADYERRQKRARE
jgi:hypothetical protein